MAGNKTIGENYSFSGVHHIFDQHKAAGSDLAVEFLIILASLFEIIFNVMHYNFTYLLTYGILFLL